MPTATLRRETAGLTRLANRDVAAIWKLSAGANVDALVALRDLLPEVVIQYGEMGSALAADWYEDERSLAAVGGRFQAIPLEPSDRGAQELIGWASKRATTNEALQALIEGGVQRRIADHVRYTITGSSIADPRARGWQRVGDGSTCTFCSMLIDRGAIYRTAEADFKAHDSCGCSAVPVWR